jgi:hypothetical protein
MVGEDDDCRDEKPSLTGIGHKSVAVEAKYARAVQSDRLQEE